MVKVDLCYTPRVISNIYNRMVHYDYLYQYYSKYNSIPVTSYCSYIKMCFTHINPNKFDYAMTPQCRQNYKLPNLFKTATVYSRSHSVISKVWMVIIEVCSSVSYASISRLNSSKNTDNSIINNQNKVVQAENHIKNNRALHKKQV